MTSTCIKNAHSSSAAYSISCEDSHGDSPRMEVDQQTFWKVLSILRQRFASQFRLAEFHARASSCPDAGGCALTSKTSCVAPFGQENQQRTLSAFFRIHRSAAYAHFRQRTLFPMRHYFRVRHMTCDDCFHKKENPTRPSLAPASFPGIVCGGNLNRSCATASR